MHIGFRPPLKIRETFSGISGQIEELQNLVWTRTQMILGALAAAHDIQELTLTGKMRSYQGG